MAKILIIDDAGFSRHMLGRIVGAVGHQIIEAENGEEGLTKILEEKPDLVLSDLLMPVMSGEELLAVLKEKQVDIPVIIMTSNIQQTIIQKCHDLGAAAFLNKPPKKEELWQKIEELLQKSG